MPIIRFLALSLWCRVGAKEIEELLMKRFWYWDSKVFHLKSFARKILVVILGQVLKIRAHLIS